jgi:hypothetical protein
MTKKQTAMQEMYSDLIQKHIVYTKSGMINEATSLVSSIELAEHLISKEKEQIIDANDSGFEDGVMFTQIGTPIYDTPEQYYNKTYGKI